MTFVDASLPLQKAILAALKADATLQALVGGKIYDTVPPSAEMPYVSFGTFDVQTEDADEYEGSDSFIQIDAWSGGESVVGSVEAKKIGRAIRGALHHANLSLDEDQRLVDLTVDAVRYLRELDGITQHVAITLRARTEPVI